MSEESQQEHISRKRVVYRIPGMDAVTFRKDFEFFRTDGGIRTMDVYLPPDETHSSNSPVVLFVAGYRFLGGMLAENLPVTFINYADAPHAFDLFHNSEASREIIRQILGFLRFHLRFQPDARSESERLHQEA